MRLPWQKNSSATSPGAGTKEINVQNGNTESPLNVANTEKPMETPVAVNGQSEKDTSEPQLSSTSEEAKDASQNNNLDDTHAEKGEEITRSTSVVTASSDGGQPGEDDESKYPKGLQLHLLTLGLVLATLVVALDNTIIATAIPRITTVFNSLDDVGWYGSAYLLTTTSLQPTFGKIYSYFNVKWTYISALVIFEIGSVLCGAALDSTMLIVGRAVAGVGAAALFSGAMIIVAYSVPLRKRPLYIGAISSIFGIASVVGPLLGGAFTDRVSWRWCFYINLPVGAIAITVVFLFFKNPDRPVSKLNMKEKLGQMDFIGAFFLICSIVCLLLALQWGGSKYSWKDSRVWGCILGFGLLMLVFTGVQLWKGDKATLPPRIMLKQRTVFGCAFFSAFLAMALYTHIFYIPFYFQAVKGTSAEESGIRTIPYLLSVTFSSVAVGGTITMIGWYVPFLWIGSATFTVACGLLYTLKVDSSPATWIGYQIFAGLGAGACVQIPFIAVQVVLNKKDMPVGNAVAIFFNTLGGALAVSIAQNIFSNALVKEIPKYTTGIKAETIIAAGATNIRKVTPPDQLAGVLTAYDIAVTQSFILAVACAGIAFCLSFLFEWKSVKGKKLDLGGGAA